MAPARVGIGDLERAKFTPESDSESATIRVQSTSNLNRTQPFNYIFRYFLRSGSPDQNLVGSLGTPLDFVHTFANDCYMRRLDFVLCSVNTITYLDYGLISGGLTNGVSMIRKSGATETEIFNVKRLIEFGHYIDDQLGQIQIVENGTENVVIASVTFEPIWAFQAGDQLITRIRDDLSKLRYHRTSVLLIEPV